MVGGIFSIMRNQRTYLGLLRLLARLFGLLRLLAFLGLFCFLACLCFVLLTRFGRLDHAILAESVKTELMAVVVEETGGVDALTVDARLEMQMLGSGTACATCQCNDVTGLDAVADLDKIL